MGCKPIALTGSGGSNPSLRTHANVAQLAEQLHGKEQVVGSNTTVGSGCVVKTYEIGYSEILIMSQDNLIKLQCASCKRQNYWSRKNKKKTERKIELEKFCKWCKKHTMHKEAKK